MERELSVPGACFKLQESIAVGSGVDCLPQQWRFSWYWNRKEIENHSPSRKDGIDVKKESQLRKLYCSFLQDIGMRLGVPQVTIATAMMFCHRFYLHQSHAKNEWQTIATVCMFLATKVEDTPCHLNKVVTLAYEMMYQRDPVAAQRIHNKDVFEKQKALILIGERLVLCTIRFDFNIQHPYKPLHEAFRKLEITQKDVRQTAWNFVNDWLRTTLCLQYKPNYIAAGSLYLAAKHHNVKLPSVWWKLFDATPLQFDAVVQQMMEILGYNRKPLAPPVPEKPKRVESPVAALAKKESSSSPDSCVLSGDGSSIRSMRHDVQEEVSTLRPKDFDDQRNTKDRCIMRDSENPNGGHEEISRGIEPKIDLERIKALMKMRKRSKESHQGMKALDNSNEDDWIERELEDGIELGDRLYAKRQKALL